MNPEKKRWEMTNAPCSGIIYSFFSSFEMVHFEATRAILLSFLLPHCSGSKAPWSAKKKLYNSVGSIFIWPLFLHLGIAVWPINRCSPPLPQSVNLIMLAPSFRTNACVRTSRKSSIIILRETTRESPKKIDDSILMQSFSPLISCFFDQNARPEFKRSEFTFSERFKIELLTPLFRPI